jgi:AraC-like DNA-binding protein
MSRFLMNVLPFVFLLGAAQGFSLALLLAGLKRGNRTANRFLIALLVVFSIDLVSSFLSITYAYRQYPVLIGIAWPLGFLYGPLLYFYVKSLTGQAGQLHRGKLFAHILPAVLMYLYLIPIFLMDPTTKGEAWFFQNSHLKNYSPIVDPILYVIILQVGGYLALSLRVLKVHVKNIRENFSSLEHISLVWLRNLIVIFFCLLCLFTFSALFSQYLGMYREAAFFFPLMTAMLIYGMGYRGIRQPEIFSASMTNPASDGTSASRRLPQTPAAVPQSQQEEENGQGGKYRKSSLTPDQSEAILAQLLHVMEQERPYRDPSLTLTMLSNMLDASPHHVSQVINEKLEKSFFDFVNEYRVQETKKALASPESSRFSVLGIALDAGFNSKSAFYTAFKKHAGMTPTQFKDRLARPEQPIQDPR